MKDRIFTVVGEKKLTIFLWNENRKFWEEIDRGHFMFHVGDTMQPSLKEDPGIEILKGTLKILEWRHKVFNGSRKMKKSIEFVTGQFSRLNVDPYMLPIAEGKIINLKTLEVRDRVFEDFCRWEVPTRYAGKISDGFLKFILEIFLRNQEMINSIQKLVGYSIIGLTTEQKLIILHGSGDNGITMFLEFIKRTLGIFMPRLINRS